MSRTCSPRPSRIRANGEHFNEKLFVDLCDLVEVRGNRSGWLVAVDRHTDYAAIAPCPSHESQAAAEKWRTKPFGNIKWRASVVGYEIVHALNKRAGGCESSSHTSVWSANEGLRRTGGTRRSRFPFERGRQRRPAGTFYHGISARGLGKTCRLGSDRKNRYLGPPLLMGLTGSMEGRTHVLLNICEESRQTKGIVWVWMKPDRWTSC